MKVVACRAWERMAQELWVMSCEVEGIGRGPYNVPPWIEWLHCVLLPREAPGSGHRHCLVPVVEGAVSAIIHNYVAAPPDMNELQMSH